MKCHELWKSKYKQNRYMEFLSNEELKVRNNDIFYNLMILSPEGKISFREINSDGKYWMGLWIEILEEFKLRNENYQNNFSKEIFILKPDLKTKAKIAIEKVGGIKDKCIYKYGKYKYNLDSLKNGKFRISPASSYNDSSLNHAIKDNELVFDIIHDPKNTSITNTKNNLKINPTSNIKITHELKTDYYVQCFSLGYTYREFTDFNCDSCLVIYDINKFIQKINEALNKKRSDFDFDTVQYIDPLQYKDDPIVFFSKHFKYSYQNEFRIVLIPKEPSTNLEEFYIEIGSMEEYAKLIVINQ